MRSARIAATIGILAAVGSCLYWLTYVPLECSRAIYRAEALLKVAEKLNDPYRDALSARQSLEMLHACDRETTNVSAPMLAALSNRILARHEQAVAAYAASLKIDRRPEIYLGLGLEQIAAGHRTAGIDSLVRSCSFDPKYLDAIDDGLAREEVRKRLTATYGADWLR